MVKIDFVWVEGEAYGDCSYAVRVKVNGVTYIEDGYFSMDDLREAYNRENIIKSIYFDFESEVADTIFNAIRMNDNYVTVEGSEIQLTQDDSEESFRLFG